jgi:selenocysteine-specific elongation factor
VSIATLLVGLAGHIDHGKTALIEALTGIKGDRLKAEQERGITIELGFAVWRPTPDLAVSFIDMPGHEDFIRNMAAGASGVEVMILVVSAAEGVMPQTREHLAIAWHLGCRRIILAVTKADLASEDMVQQRLTEGEHLLKMRGLAPEAMVTVSARTGQGMEQLAHILTSLRPAPTQEGGIPRMPVDRVFQRVGIGTIVTGTLRQGRLETQQHVCLSPSGRRARVRALHIHGIEVQAAEPGQRVAIALADVASEEIARGDVLSAEGAMGPSLACDALVHLDQPVRLSQLNTLFVHAGTAICQARLVPLEAQSRELPAGAHLMQLRFQTPASLLAGDRFALRSSDGRSTLGGGQVLTLDPQQRRRRDPDRVRILRLLGDQGLEQALEGIARLSPFALDLSALARAHGCSRLALEEMASRQALMALPVVQGRNWRMHPAVILTLQRAMMDRLAAHHVQEPDQPGMTDVRLLAAMPFRLAPDAFPSLVAHFIARRVIEQDGRWLRLPGHLPQLSPQHEALWREIQPWLRGENLLQPLRLPLIAEDLRKRPDTLRGVLKRLARMGQVQEIAEDLFVDRDAVQHFEAVLHELTRTAETQWFSAADYRDALGIGRKMAILVLEFFDRQGTTLRKGDLRRLNPLARNQAGAAPNR